MSINAYDKVAYNNLNLPSLQEMMQVPAYLTQKHEEAQEQIGELGAQGDLISNIAETNPEINKRYLDYKQQINSLGELLSSKGVAKANIRANVGKAKATYMKNIVPVLKADEMLRQDKDFIQKAKISDSSLIMNYAPSQYTHDAYLARGNQSLIPEMVSGQALSKSFAEKMSRLASEIQSTQPELYATGLPFQWMGLLKQGLTPAQASAALSRNFSPEALGQFNEYIQSSLNSTLNEHGVYDKFKDNPQAIEQAINSALSGVYAGIGGTKVDMMQDSYGMQVAQDDRRFNREMTLVQAKKAADAETETHKQWRVTSSATVGDNFKEARRVAKALKADPEVTMQGTLDALEAAGIPTKESTGEYRTKEALLRDAYRLNTTLVTASTLYNIDANSVYAKQLASQYAPRATSKEKKLIAFDNDGIPTGFKGIIQVNPLTGQIQLQGYDDKAAITLDAGRFSTGLEEYLNEIRSNVGEVLGINVQPGTPINTKDLMKGYQKVSKEVYRPVQQALDAEKERALNALENPTPDAYRRIMAEYDFDSKRGIAMVAAIIDRKLQEAMGGLGSAAMAVTQSTNIQHKVRE